VAETALCANDGDHILCAGDGMPVVEGAPDLYGQWISYSPEVLCAVDLDMRLCNDVANSLLWAAKEWGSVGPIEYYVMGIDESAADSLIDVYCSRRWDRNSWSKDECLAESTRANDHSMKSYQSLSAAWLAEGNPSTTMGHNGGRQFNIHQFTSSVPWGFDASYDVGFIEGVQEQKTVFHEYFHALQHNYIVTKDWDERDSKMWLRWFAEGSAEYMASVLARRLTDAGLLDSRLSEIAGKSSYDFTTLMRQKLVDTKAAYSQCGGSLKDSGYGDKCDSYEGAYSGGTWAHAYLANKHGSDILLDVFYPNLDAMGSETAFTHAYGQTVEEFYTEFDEFLDLTTEEQMAILP